MLGRTTGPRLLGPRERVGETFDPMSDARPPWVEWSPVHRHPSSRGTARGTR